MELEVIQNEVFLKALVESIGGLKGASTLVVVAGVVQLLIKFLKTPWAGFLFKNVKGSVKLALVAGLTLIGGVSGLMLVEGLSFAAAAIHSTSLTALTVFLHQIYKHFTNSES